MCVGWRLPKARPAFALRFAGKRGCRQKEKEPLAQLFSLPPPNPLHGRGQLNHFQLRHLLRQLALHFKRHWRVIGKGLFEHGAALRE